MTISAIYAQSESISNFVLPLFNPVHLRRFLKLSKMFLYRQMYKVTMKHKCDNLCKTPGIVPTTYLMLIAW